MSAAAGASAPTLRDYQAEAIADVRAFAATALDPRRRAALLALAQRAEAVTRAGRLGSEAQK